MDHQKENEIKTSPQEKVETGKANKALSHQIEVKDTNWATKNSSYVNSNNLVPQDDLSEFNHQRQEFLAQSGGKHLNDEREQAMRGWDNEELARDELSADKD